MPNEISSEERRLNQETLQNLCTRYARAPEAEAKLLAEKIEILSTAMGIPVDYRSLRNSNSQKSPFYVNYYE